MSSYSILIYSGSDPAIKPYESMIYKDFLKTLRYGNDWYKEIFADAYYNTYQKVIFSLLNRPSTVIKLAVLTEDYDTCLGWSMTEGQTIHYVHVKRDFRKQGIGGELIPKNVEAVTHLTKIGKSIWKKSYRDAIFNPFF